MGKYDVDDFGSGRINTFIDIKVAEVDGVEVIFDNIMDARSARMDCGFCR